MALRTLITTLTLTLVFPIYASADLAEQISRYNGLFGLPPNSTTIMTSSALNRGREMRPKTVLKGVFYFGGSDVKSEALSENLQQFLCQNGFSVAYSVYKSVNKTVNCSGNQYSYRTVSEAPASGRGDKIYQLMGHLHEIITKNGTLGPVYVHCHYGVHASNTIAQMVLKQFCDIGDSQAQTNWNKINYANSLPADRVRLQFSKIANFQPYAEFQITPAQRQAICF